jgi:hypothetical protein
MEVVLGRHEVVREPLQDPAVLVPGDDSIHTLPLDGSSAARHSGTLRSPSRAIPPEPRAQHLTRRGGGM